MYRVRQVFEYSDNLILMGMDTRPTLESNGYIKMLHHFKYNTLVLGSPDNNPQPDNGPLFRYFFWRYRFDRYFEKLTDIQNGVYDKFNGDTVVIITDMNDTSVHGPPSELIRKFRNTNKDIVISGQAYCCNIDRIRILSELSPEKNYESFVAKINADPSQYSQLLEGMWGNSSLPTDIPGLLRYTDSKDIVKILKDNNENTLNSNYRYVNAGTLVGKVSKILEMFREIKSDSKLYTRTLDDEGNINQWYAQNLKKTGSKMDVIIDFNQKIFAVIDELENRPKEQELLLGNKSTEFFPYTYDSSLKRYKNKYNETPIIVHYAGIYTGGLHATTSSFINKLNDVEHIFDRSNREDKEFMDMVSTCGKRKITQDDRNICNALGCVYNSGNNVKCEYDISTPRRFYPYNEDFQIKWLHGHNEIAEPIKLRNTNELEKILGGV